MNAIVKVDFYGDTVLAQRDREIVLVAVKPIVERLGLDWPSQYSRIKRDEILERSIVIITMETPAGSRDAVALPLNLLPGFLFGISIERISDPDSRAAVLRYKEECYSVLYQHFYGRKEERPRDWDDVAGKLMMVKQARLAFGAKAARDLWGRLGLPPVDSSDNVAPSKQHGLSSFLNDFLEECTIREGGTMAQAGELYRLYGLWAEANKAPHFTRSMFGRLVAYAGIRKRQSNLIYYLGIRICHDARERLQGLAR